MSREPTDRESGTTLGQSGTVLVSVPADPANLGQTAKHYTVGCPRCVSQPVLGETPTPQPARVSTQPGYSGSRGLSATERALLADLATEYGARPFTSARAAALLDRHVRGVGTFLGRAARSRELIAAETGPARLVRVRTVQNRLSLWVFEPAGREDVL